MRTIVKSGLIIAAFLLFFGCLWNSLRAAAQNQQAKKEALTVTAEQMAQAKTLFGDKCARCHGVDGRGQTLIGGMLGAPDFTNQKWWKEDVSDARLTNSITKGKDQMPPFGKKLSKQEIAALVAYVRRFNKLTE